MNIGILGSGVVGQALATGYPRHGHEVRIGNRSGVVEGFTAGTYDEVVGWAELLVLAVKGDIAAKLVASLSDGLAGKVLIDATNPLEFSTGAPGLFVGHDDSLGEQIQRAAPAALVVKAYNIVGNTLMVDPQLPSGPPTMLLGGDDAGAKATVVALLEQTGWQAVDLGGIEVSRYLEPIALAWVLYGVRSGTWNHAFKVLSD